MIKILQVVHSFIPYTMAGTEIYAYKLSKELLKKNAVFVFFRINNPKEKEYSLAKNNYEGLETYAINRTLRFCHSFEDTYSDSTINKKFGALLDEISPDVVHIHHLLFLSCGIINEIKNRDIPFLYTLHDYWLMCYRGQMVKDDLTMCKGYFASECADCLKYLLSMRKHSMYFYNIFRKIFSGYPLEVLKKIYFSFASLGLLQSSGKIRKWRDSLAGIYADANLFIAPSRFIKNKFIEYGISEKKIIYLPNGFDSRGVTFIPKTKSDALRFGYAGVLLPTKGLDVLLSAFKNITHENIKLSIYGKIASYSGFEDYPRLLKKMIGDDKRIKLKGPYDNKNVADIFSDIEILIVPSIWPENAPLVIQEAFLSNAPVIASRIGGIPELVTDGVNGLLFNPGDIKDLKEKMEYIINNPNMISKFKDNMPKVKSIEDNAKEMEEIYSKLIKERS